MGRRPKGSLPQVRRHPSGQARVRIGDKEFWLGRHGSPEAQQRFDELIMGIVSRRLQASGSARPAASTTAPADTLSVSPDLQAAVDTFSDAAKESAPITVAEVCCEFLEHAHRSYKNGTGSHTSTLGNIKQAIKVLRRFDDVSAEAFGPLLLEELMHSLAEEELPAKSKTGTARPRTRQAINRIIKMVRYIFRWAASRELIPPAVPDALEKLQLLRRGRTAAPENTKVRPVSDETIERTLPHLPATVADIVMLQRYSGCRPGEACQLICGEVDRTSEPWVWRPASHKNAWRDHAREIYLGPKARDLLRSYLDRKPEEFCFVAGEAEKARNAARRKQRKSPMTPSHRRRRKAAAAKKRPTSPYTVAAYRRAITRACDAAGIPRWAPNQIRHLAACEARAADGLDAAQARLGHASAKTTEIYAELGRQKAAKVAEELG